MKLALLATSLAALAALAAPLPPLKLPGKADLKALQGEWEAVRSGGLKSDGIIVTVSVKGDRMSCFVNGEMRTTWVFTLDPAKSPKAMDLRLLDSKGSGDGPATLLAAYHVEGDLFLFAYGSERPSGLDTKKPEGWAYVCKRKK